MIHFFCNFVFIFMFPFQTKPTFVIVDLPQESVYLPPSEDDFSTDKLINFILDFHHQPLQLKRLKLYEEQTDVETSSEDHGMKPWLH